MSDEGDKDYPTPSNEGVEREEDLKRLAELKTKQVLKIATDKSLNEPGISVIELSHGSMNDRAFAAFLRELHKELETTSQDILTGVPEDDLSRYLGNENEALSRYGLGRGIPMGEREKSAQDTMIARFNTKHEGYTLEQVTRNATGQTDHIIILNLVRMPDVSNVPAKPISN